MLSSSAGDACDTDTDADGVDDLCDRCSGFDDTDDGDADGFRMPATIAWPQRIRTRPTATGMGSAIPATSTRIAPGSWS